MPKPSNIQAFPRPDLAQVAYEFSLQAATSGFIAPVVLPAFDSATKTGQFPVIPAEALLELPDTRRAPRSAYQRGDWDYKMDDFSCKENGWEEPVDDDEAAVFKTYFSAEVVATLRAMGIILRSHEKRVADKVFDLNTFENAAAGNEWDDYANADPLADVNLGKKYFEESTGLVPNALIINRVNYRHLGMIDAVIDRIKFTTPSVQKGELAAELLAGYFGVERVLVAGGAYNSAPKGRDAQIARIWDTDMAMLACLSSGGEDLREPCLGRSFSWESGTSGSGGTPIMVEDYREEQTRSNVIRCRQNTDEKIQFTGAGYIIKGLVTTQD